MEILSEADPASIHNDISRLLLETGPCFPIRHIDGCISVHEEPIYPPLIFHYSWIGSG